jgi:hypothetical protein
MERDPLRIPRSLLDRSRRLRLPDPIMPLPRWRVSGRLRDLALGLTILVIGPAAAVTLAGGAVAGAAGTPASVPVLTVPAVHISGLSSAYLDVSAGLPQSENPVSTPLPQVMLPTPVPAAATVPAVTYPPGSVEAIITAAADAAGVDPAWMISTASCESGLRPDAYNPAGPYEGLFQFLPSTFAAHGGTDIWDPVQQSQIAASMFAGGDSSAWPVCSRR